jgi:SAM-dependent methyltransferase
MADPTRITEGDSTLAHMMLLARAPERLLALRLAMSSAIGPTSVVLDAGCGSLAVLSIMAARLGARRVVAVDTGRFDAAQALAEENGVADRIEFVQGNLADLPAATGSFDVILGMIYHNEPGRDLARQQLMAGLASRLAHPGTAFIPGTVRYTVTGYDSAGADPGERTLHDRWDSTVGQAEALSGITMAAVRPFPSADHSGLREQLSAGSRDMTLLTSRELFTEVRYTDPATAAAYPADVALTVTAPGRLDTTIWRQDLKFGDLLIRRSEATHPVTPPRDVQPGDSAIVSTGGAWGDAIPLTLRRGNHVDLRELRFRRTRRSSVPALPADMIRACRPPRRGTVFARPGNRGSSR